MQKHTRTKMTAIPKDVKHIVWERDNYSCIICGMPGDPVCHVVNRSQGGLGVAENIVTMCVYHHMEMDNGKNGKALRERAIEYLKSRYPGWERDRVIYHKQP